MERKRERECWENREIFVSHDWTPTAAWHESRRWPDILTVVSCCVFGLANGWRNANCSYYHHYYQFDGFGWIGVSLASPSLSDLPSAFPRRPFKSEMYTSQSQLTSGWHNSTVIHADRIVMFVLLRPTWLALNRNHHLNVIHFKDTNNDYTSLKLRDFGTHFRGHKCWLCCLSSHYPSIYLFTKQVNFWIFKISRLGMCGATKSGQGWSGYSSVHVSRVGTFFMMFWFASFDFFDHL